MNLNQLKSDLTSAEQELTRTEGMLAMAQQEVEKLEEEIKELGFTPATLDKELRVIEKDVEAATEAAVSELEVVKKEVGNAESS